MLQRNGEDIASKSVFNEANLKEHLRGKTADELIEELEKLYDEEELTGEEFDPRIVEIYIEAMEKVSPPDPAAERAFDRSWALFHTKHRVEKEPSSSHRAVKIRWRIEAAVLIVIFLCVSAAAFGWKDYIITWKDELFGTVPHIPGTMELKEPNVSGYRSYGSSDPDTFYAMDTIQHGGDFYFDGMPGVKYRAVMVAYAKNASGYEYSKEMACTGRYCE